MRTELAKIEIKNQKNPKFTEMVFQGELDSTGLVQVRDEIYAQVGALNKAYLVFNFAELDYINSESIGMLIQVQEMLQKKGHDLVIVNAQKIVADVLNVIGISESVDCYKSMADFLRKI